MMTLFSSPIIRLLVAVNVLTLMALAIPKIWPLPEADTYVAPNNNEVLSDFLGGNGSIDQSPARSRPIFHENRRPPQIKTESVQAPVREVRKEFAFNLVGIVGSSQGQRTAYIQNSETGETLSVQESNIVADWTISKVEADHILVENESDQRRIELSPGG